MNYVMAKSGCPVDLRAWTMLAWQLNCIKPASVNNNGPNKTPVKII
jgi:hypothetical protein